MKKRFDDPIAVKQNKEMKSPWDYRAPCYDERTSCFINTGSHYGVGHTQPVGHKGDPKKDVAALPRTSKIMMEDERLVTRNLPLDMNI
jgi:hypothetical protein